MTTCRCEDVVLDGDTGEEYKSAHWQKIRVDNEKWSILYRCPRTGKYWKEHFPYSEAQAGGPPVFDPLTADEARREFKLEDELK
jgi:hypothetical protein